MPSTPSQCAKSVGSVAGNRAGRSMSDRAGAKSKAITPPERLHSTASRLDTGDPTTGPHVDGVVSADLLIKPSVESLTR